jgi:hypothetical protein
VFENRVLRRIFGPKRDEVMGEWRKLHNEELHNLYSSPDIIRQVKSRQMRWAGHVARMGDERNVYKVFVGKPEGKRPLGRPRHRWEDGIRMDLRETGLGGCGMDSTGSGQGPVASCFECGDEPSGSCATELVSSIIAFPLHYDLPSALLDRTFSAKILYECRVFCMRATCVNSKLCDHAGNIT